MTNAQPALDDESGTLYLQLVQACAAGCSQAEAFRHLVRRYVRPLISHRFSIAVLGALSFDQLSMKSVIGVDYPEQFLAMIRTESNIRERPVVARWIASREPIVIDPGVDRSGLSSLEIQEIDTFGLGRLAIHGQLDISSRMGSYFSLAGVSEATPEEDIKFRLRLIAPHLHAALMSIPAVREGDMGSDAPDLTALERDLLLWLAAGRSNAQIAQLRGRSIATIRNQLHALYRKLGVVTRTEAVAVSARFSGL